MKEKLIRALLVKPHEKPEEILIENELSYFQKEIEGYIEVIRLEDDAVIICNEEGKLRNLPLNRGIFDPDGNPLDIIRGSFLIVYAPFGSEDFLSLPHSLMKKYKARFTHPEYYVSSSKNF